MVSLVLFDNGRWCQGNHWAWIHSVWIPAWAGMTVGWRAPNSHGLGGWIPPFAGMTGRGFPAVGAALGEQGCRRSLRGGSPKLVREMPAAHHDFPAKQRRTWSSQKGQEDACSNGGTDNSGHVGSHSVHEEKVGRVCFPSHCLTDSGGHGNG